MECQWIRCSEVRRFPEKSITYDYTVVIMTVCSWRNRIQCPLLGHWVILQMLDKMITFAMCLNWFCFCVYYKGWSGYSTIGGRTRYSAAKSMSDNSSAKVECDACENCTKLSSDKSSEKTAAMVSQAEIWQEDKKFTVLTFFNFIQTFSIN